nr:hypothetical protein B0A51_00103 [Rachicladosporium sp. CCFEE 5018]
MVQPAPSVTHGAIASRRQAVPRGRRSGSEDVTSLTQQAGLLAIGCPTHVKKSAFESLPTELLEYIFDALKRDHQRHIAACRLVSRTFNLHSSPFFITELVIANRLTEVARAKRILDHPLFSQHITTLIYDASLWPDGQGDHDTFREYGDKLATASRRRPLRNEQVVRRQANEVRMLDELGLRELHHVDPPELETTRAGMSTLVGQQSTRELGTRLQDQMAVYRDQRLDAFGSHVGYLSCLEYQRLIIKAGIIPGMIKRALVKLPKLDRLIFTDWRGLGKNGESRGDLCTRLFHNIIEPHTLDGGQWSILSNVMQVLAQSGGYLKHLSIGDNLFGPEGSISDNSVKRVAGLPLAFVRETLDQNGFFIDYRRLATKLQTLSLPVLFASDEASDMDECRNLDVPALKHILQIIAPNVVDLTLLLSCTKSWRQYNMLDALYRVRPVQPFQDILKDIEFPNLKTLHLDGWPFSASDMAHFLTNNVPTLRHLHLTNCIVDCASPDYTDFTTDAAPFASLHGLEISSLYLNDSALDPIEDLDELYAQINETEDEDERQGFETVVSFTHGTEAEEGSAANDRKVEELLMGGRENKIKRRAKRRMSGVEGVKGKWWEEAQYWKPPAPTDNALDIAIVVASSHITTVIYDASSINAYHSNEEDLRTWELPDGYTEQYEDTISRAARLRPSLRDSEAGRKRALELEMWRIAGPGPVLPTRVLDAYHSAEMGYDLTPEQEELVERGDHVETSTAARLYLRESDFESAERASASRGLAEYKRLSFAEWRIERQGLVMKLLRGIWKEAPKVANLVLEPTRSDDRCLVTDGWLELSAALQAAHDSGAPLKCVSIGDNTFEPTGSGLDVDELRRRPGCVLAYLLDGVPGWLDLAHGLQQLYLPIAFHAGNGVNGDEIDLSRIDAGLAHGRSLFDNLITLTLDIIPPFIGFWQPANRRAVRNMGTILEMLQTSTKRLRTLTLKGAIFRLDDIAAIVSASASTLRYLHLLHCTIERDPTRPSEVFTDPLPYTTLEGVKVAHLQLVDALPESEDDRDESSTPPHLINASSGRLDDERVGHLGPYISDTFGCVYFGPKYDRVHEAAMMDGRTNAVVRKEVIPMQQEVNKYWYPSWYQSDAEGERTWSTKPHYW